MNCSTWKGNGESPGELRYQLIGILDWRNYNLRHIQRRTPDHAPTSDEFRAPGTDTGMTCPAAVVINVMC